jgi:hypothetical protein
MKQLEHRRALLVDNQDYRSYVELTTLSDARDRITHHLKFKVVEIVNSEPQSEECKFQLFLTPDDLDKLKSIL